MAGMAVSIASPLLRSSVTAGFRANIASSSRSSLISFPRPSAAASYIAYRHTSTFAQESEQPSGLAGVLSPAYSGTVPPPSSMKGKVKELHSVAPPTAQPTSAPPAARARPTIRSKKAAISMTPAAIDHLRALISSPTDPKLLRIGVKTRGCAGMAYHLDYVAPPGGKFDEVVEQDGVRVLIDSKALFSIIGSKMDWRDNRLSAGFVFDNPNVVDTCGCGESFNLGANH